jgi:hypothetical protein
MLSGEAGVRRIFPDGRGPDGPKPWTIVPKTNEPLDGVAVATGHRAGEAPRQGPSRGYGEIGPEHRPEVDALAAVERFVHGLGQGNEVCGPEVEVDGQGVTLRLVKRIDGVEHLNASDRLMGKGGRRCLDTEQAAFASPDARRSG